MEFFDELEQRDPLLREQEQLRQLATTVQQARAGSEYYCAHLAAGPAEVADRTTLAQLPLTRKRELGDLQRQFPPFGLATLQPPQLAQLFVSPGPLYEPGLAGADPWRFARALHAAGFQSGMRVLNTFAYHFTPAGRMFEAAAHALGCAVIPAGPGQTEQQLRTIADLRPDGYVGTPSFLKLLLDKGAESGVDCSCLRCALVTGEALPGVLREALGATGLTLRQCYGTAELGLIAYETIPGEGLVCDESILVEIVRPGTGDPLPDGEVGEVVVTVLAPDYPLIRFATGDLSAILPGGSPCGRTGPRLRGWLGRADQSAKVRGMFVHPEQVATILKRHQQVAKGRLLVERVQDQDVMTLCCEVTGTGEAGLEEALIVSLREVCGLRGAVQTVPFGSLPNDGKVIEDRRPVG